MHFNSTHQQSVLADYDILLQQNYVIFLPSYCKTVRATDKIFYYVIEKKDFHSDSLYLYNNTKDIKLFPEMILIDLIQILFHFLLFLFQLIQKIQQFSWLLVQIYSGD